MWVERHLLNIHLVPIYTRVTIVYRENMMNDKPCVKVNFDQTSAVYQLGEEAIKGNVRISLSRLMKTQMIKIEFKGICEYNWKKRDFAKKNQKHKSDQHFNIKDIILTPRSEYNDLFLQPGDHNFPFVFELPDSLPATFTADDSRIEYFARVVVHYRDEGSMEVNKIQTEEPFIVKKTINSFPTNLLQSIEIKKQLTLPKFFSRSTLIDVSSKVPKSIYHRGETVRLHCDYDVMSGAKGKVSGVSAALMQSVHVVKPNGNERTRSREIVRAPPFHGSDGSSKWSDIYIKIPTNISLTVQESGSITISYYIQIGAAKSKESLVIPIVIIDNDASALSSQVRPRRFSLTGTPNQLPSVFQTFNTFSRNDPARLSTSSIDSHRLYYSDD